MTNCEKRRCFIVVEATAQFAIVQYSTRPWRGSATGAPCKWKGARWRLQDRSIGRTGGVTATDGIKEPDWDPNAPL
jgi:hypothetical protein